MQLEEWLAHPGVLGAALPFAVATVVAAMLSRTRWLSVAQAAGFASSVTLAIGWSFESLTSTRKLALIGVASLVLCVLVERFRPRVAGIASAVLLAASSAWVFWRLFVQKDFPSGAWAGLAVASYVAWQSAATLRVSRDPVRGTAAASALGIGTGTVAILGASAALGVVALSAGAAAAATLFVQATRGRQAPAGQSSSLPATVASAMAGPAAVMTAELPWYSLLPMLAVAPAAMLPAPAGVRWRAALAFFLSLVPAIAAVGLAWFRPF